MWIAVVRKGPRGGRRTARVRWCVRSRGARSGAWRRPSTGSRPTARTRTRPTWRPGSPPSGRWSARSTRSWPGSPPGTTSPADHLGQPGLLTRASRWETWGLAGHDVDVDPGGDLGVQPDADLVRAERLNRVADLDPAPVEYGTARLEDRLGDVGGPDRAEQPAVAARAPPHPHLQTLKLVGDELGVRCTADLAGRAGPLDQLDLLLRAAGP